MSNNTKSYTEWFFRPIVATTTVCGSAALATGWWVYDQLITHPLRTFYFKGPWWHNIPQYDICARMMGNKVEFTADMYNSSELMRERCRQMIDREFESWEATTMVVLYVTVLTFGVAQLLCHCCIVRPIVRAMGVVRTPTN